MKTRPKPYRHNFYKSIERYTCVGDEEILGSLDTETTGSYLHHDDRMFYLSITTSKVMRLHPLLPKANVFSWEWDVDPETRQPKISDLDKQVIADILARRDITWIIHNAIFDSGVLAKEIPGFDPIEFLKRCHDTMLMSHAWNSLESHGAKDLGIKYLNILDTDQKDLKKAVMEARAIAASLGWKIASKENLPMYGRAPKSGWWVVDMWLPRAVAKYHKYPKKHPWWKICSTYGDKDTLRGLGLFLVFRKGLRQEGLWAKYMENRTSLVPCFSMEYQGLHVHKKRAKTFRERFDDTRARVEPVVAASLGQRFFRPNSVDDIRKVLYHDFRLPVIFTTKKGNPSTGKDVLTDIIKRLGPSKDVEDFEPYRPPMQVEAEPYSDYRNRLNNWSEGLEEHEQLFFFCSALMMWKKLRASSNIIGTYLDKMIGYTLYPRYNPTGTHSVRLSSSDPNGQNISQGKLAFIEFLFKYSLSLRALFGPNKKEEWWSLDFKQLELMIFAYMSKDQRMIDWLEEGRDFHTEMARIIFNVMEPNKAQRTIAKNVNFGFIYGAQPAKIEKTALMPGCWDTLCRNFPGATGFMEQTTREVTRYGFVETAGGYRLYVPEDKPFAGVNYKVQGTGGVIAKRAMVGTHDYLERNDNPLRLLSNIHDELLYRGAAGAGRPVIGTIRDIMEQSGESLGIPVKVDCVYIDKSWAEQEVKEVTWGADGLPRVEDAKAMRRMLGLINKAAI